MNFSDYYELKKQAASVGIEKNPSLTQLLHLLQAKQKAEEHFKQYMDDMDMWERNCAKCVREEIRWAGEQK